MPAWLTALGSVWGREVIFAPTLVNVRMQGKGREREGEVGGGGVIFEMILIGGTLKGAEEKFVELI